MYRYSKLNICGYCRKLILFTSPITGPLAGPLAATSFMYLQPSQQLGLGP
jgi:hypothetical protein